MATTWKEFEEQYKLYAQGLINDLKIEANKPHGDVSKVINKHTQAAELFINKVIKNTDANTANKLRLEAEKQLKLEHSPRVDPVEDVKKQLKQSDRAGTGQRFKQTPWGKFDEAPIRQMIEQISSAITANPNAGQAITQLRDKDLKEVLRNAAELKLRLAPAPRPRSTPKPRPGE